MLKRIFIAAAIMVASPAIVSAQDIFWSFSSTSVVDAFTDTVGNTNGTAYLFSDGLFGFDAADIDLTTSDPSVLQITGGAGINPTFNGIGGLRFDSADVTADGAGGGNFFPISATQNGINPAVAQIFDPEYNSTIGANGAFLLAEVNYSIVGPGSATLGLALGDQGVLEFPDSFLDPSFGTATLTAVTIPEPSSLALLILGSVGLVARRKRA